MAASRHPSRRSHLILLLVLIAFVFGSCSNELDILLDIKASLEGSNSNMLKTWQPNIPTCSFEGVACNSQGLVSELNLSYKGLSGNLPVGLICQLEGLTNVSLGFNSLHGNVTHELNKCVNLKYLDLGNNRFTGEVPDLSSLSQLEYLYLNNSGFSGNFPWKALQNMTGLKVLSIGDIPFDRFSFPAEILRLEKLNWLYMSNCSLEGKIPPEIGNLLELGSLEMSDNNLIGEIPPEIGKLGKLWRLELYNNSLSGKLPIEMKNLTSLELFDASTNHLEGDLSVLRFSKNLVSLQLFENHFSGEVPVEFGDFRRLVNLSLYTNKLTGPLPQKLGSWADFDYIDVSENFLTGTIPPDMCKNGKMKELLMLQNNFSGEIPESYGSCVTLTRFRVSKNSLTGVVPAKIWGLPNMNIIDIAFNQLEGPITSDIGNAKSLGQLSAENNKLSGELPGEMSEAISLYAIDLSFNKFSGKLPSKIGDLKKLGRLNLQNNLFSGSIPKSMGSCDSLSYANMANNQLSGNIPSSLGSLPTLNSLNLSKNQLSGQIPGTLSSLTLSLFDLSYNKLSGPIPDSLAIEAYKGSFSGNPGLCSLREGSFQRCQPKSHTSKHIRTLVMCFAVGSLVLLVSVGCYLTLKKKEKGHERSLKDVSWDFKSFHVLSFTEDEILDSVKEENLIGKGGSGSVYKVALSDGKELAVKHIWNADLSGAKRHKSSAPILMSARKSKEFESEVQTLSSIRHVNVVKLYCSITSEDSSLLVYEYMPNGSLWDRLHTSQKMELDWETRYEIALGAAKGLEYLHHGCDRPVIHRDVKTSNILLDEFLKPRIADFGLAKIVQATGGKDSTHVITGTHGYIAPEYGYTYKVNEKCDVYSFGVVLLELVTGKRPIEPEYGDNKDIVHWISSKLDSKEKVLNSVDSRIPAPYRDDALKVLRIAILCTARLPAHRPTMRSVVQMLEEAEPCKLVSIVITKDTDNLKKVSAEKKLNSDSNTQQKPDITCSILGRPM